MLGLFCSTFSSHADLLGMRIPVCRNYTEKFQRHVGIVMVYMLHSTRYSGPVSRLHVIAFALNFNIAVSAYRVHKVVPFM